MSIVLLKNIGLNYVTKPILTDISMQISKGEKYALIGNNRSGKSSLMKIISGILEPDAGEVVHTRGSRTIYIEQEIDIKSLELTGTEYIRLKNESIFALMSRYQIAPDQQSFDQLTVLEGHNFDSRLANLLKLFSIPNINAQMKNNSGGINKKIQLIAAFIFNSDLVLLDEPTNHLDMEGIEELEKLLNSNSGAIMIVSHDRLFLDNVTNHFLEIWDKRIYVHKGKYDDFLDAKSRRLENEASEAWKLNQYIKRELKWVNAGVKARAVKDKGRLQRFDEIAHQDKALTETNVDLLLPTPLHLGTRILDFENVNILNSDIEGGDKILLGPMTFKFEKDTKVGIVGPNGSYKSTLIKAILGELPDIFRTTGTIKSGINTKYLYLDQNKSQLKEELTVFDYISEGKEQVMLGEAQSMSTYKYLDNWLFFKDQHRTQVKYLSGGEKSKLLLAKKLLQSTNFLILDEPTNDLDLDTIMLLESNLRDYEAPMIIISHDRAFLNHICNVIISTNDIKPIISYGNYDNYHTKYHRSKVVIEDYTNLTTPKNISKKDLRKDKAELRELEKKIDQLELTLKKIETDLIDPEIYSDFKKVNELVTKKERLSVRLDEYYVELLG